MLGFIFGWNRKVRKLRKKWDRLREKTLKKKNPIRKMALEKLDSIENNLRTIEEQRIPKMDRSRISKEIEIGLAEVNGLLKTKPEELLSQQRRHPGV